MLTPEAREMRPNLAANISGIAGIFENASGRNFEYPFIFEKISIELKSFKKEGVKFYYIFFELKCLKGTSSNSQ